MMIHPADSVAMANQAAFAVDDESLLLIEDMTSELLLKIVLYPHIMVAGEEVNLNAILMQLIQHVEQAETASGDYIAILEPEIENIA